MDDRLLPLQAKADAWKVIKTDPELERDEYQELKKVFTPYFKQRAEYFGIG